MSYQNLTKWLFAIFPSLPLLRLASHFIEQSFEELGATIMSVQTQTCEKCKKLDVKSFSLNVEDKTIYKILQALFLADAKQKQM